MSNYGKDVLEVTVERIGRGALEEEGFFVRKDGRQGWPDRLVLLRNGRHFWWEAKKRRGGRLTRGQKIIIPALRSRGDIVLVRPSLEELVSVALFLNAGDEAAARAAPSNHEE